MDVNEIDKSKYTHIHFAFADVTSTYTIDVSGHLRQFNLFKAITGIKKIISFGGWDFSTMLRTYNTLREAFKSANRATLIRNIVAFVKKHNLDGVDIDWEYPGVSDTLSHALSTVSLRHNTNIDGLMLTNIESARHSRHSFRVCCYRKGLLSDIEWPEYGLGHQQVRLIRSSGFILVPQSLSHKGNRVQY